MRSSGGEEEEEEEGERGPDAEEEEEHARDAATRDEASPGPPTRSEWRSRREHRGADIGARGEESPPDDAKRAEPDD